MLNDEIALRCLLAISARTNPYQIPLAKALAGDSFQPMGGRRGAQKAPTNCGMLLPKLFVKEKSRPIFFAPKNFLHRLSLLPLVILYCIAPLCC
jgi:hypothetical protein